MRNKTDFPSAPQKISKKQYPLRKRSQSKTRGVTKIIEVTDQ